MNTQLYRSITATRVKIIKATRGVSILRVSLEQVSYQDMIFYNYKKHTTLNFIRSQVKAPDSAVGSYLLWSEQLLWISLREFLVFGNVQSLLTR